MRNEVSPNSYKPMLPFDTKLTTVNLMNAIIVFLLRFLISVIV